MESLLGIEAKPKSWPKSDISCTIHLFVQNKYFSILGHFWATLTLVAHFKWKVLQNFFSVKTDLDPPWFPF